MGNYNSCKNFSSPMMIKNTTATTRVILPGGEIRRFGVAVKAAELMLESSNYFLVNSRSLSIGKRFSPIIADEDLELGHVYLMFPMKRKNSVVTAADMAVVLMATKATPRRITGEGAAKVDYLEESEVGGGESKLKLDEIMEGFQVGELYGYKLGTCRSRKPLLATISEEVPVCIR